MLTNKWRKCIDVIVNIPYKLYFRVAARAAGARNGSYTDVVVIDVICIVKIPYILSS